MNRELYLNILGPLLGEQKGILRAIGKSNPTPEQLEALKKNMDEKCKLLARYRIKEEQ